jgi:non-specific serine/threonine protein kinase
MALLAYLAVTGRSHSRDRLATLFWPDYDQTRARATLRRTLSMLKNVLAGELLTVDRETIGLGRSADLRIDVNQFQGYLSECRRHGHTATEACPACINPLTKAVKIYQDDFMAGFSLRDSPDFDDWQLAESQRLRDGLTGALERLVRCHKARGEFEEAIAYAGRLVSLNPQEETTKLYESIKENRKITVESMPLRSPDTTLNNPSGLSPQESALTLSEAKGKGRSLPRQLTSFIGREREIAEVKSLLSKAHLLTLTGAGGCGKTRLALQVASDLVDGYKDGVWLVDLAPFSEPSLVPQAVARALDVSEQIGRPFLDTLVDYLRSKEILLVLDNCEHLIEACATLCEGLLRVCPELKILATSRERLGIAGETAYRVPSLSLPDPLHLRSIGASDLGQYEAVSLFIDRAVATLTTFTVADGNASTVAQICYRLDGIPLAIELAAVRVKALSVEQILSRLDDRFRLLTGGSRTALPRHQTLKATMDWSYDLLSEAERTLLSRLSAFAGGWTLQAAEAICADLPGPSSIPVDGGKRDGARVSSIHPDEVLDVLTNLVDKSLVVVEGQDGEVRYRLLQTVRQYALERLTESGEEEWIRRHHADFFLALAEKAEANYHGPDQKVWLDRLETEHSNLQAALEWSLKGEEGDVGTRHDMPLLLAGALWWFWFARGYLSEGRQWLERASSGRSGASASARAKVLYGAGFLATLQGDFRRAAALCQESLPLCREANDKRGIATSVFILGLVAYYQGDYGRAVELCEESLALFREERDRWEMAHSFRLLGQVASDQGDYSRAGGLCEESLSLFRGLGDKWGIALSLRNLGLAARYQRDYKRAAALFEESLALCRELGDKWGIGHSLRNLGFVAIDLSDHSRASELLKEGLTLYKELGVKSSIAECLEGLAEGAGAQEQMERAARLYGAAEAMREAVGVPIQPSDRPGYDRSVVAVRAGLGEEAFAKAWEEGRKMSMEQAIDYAISS